MPAQKRFKTRYPGVFYIEGAAVGTGKPERVFCIRYRKDGKSIEEKAGRQYQDNMTPAKAATMRAEKIKGHTPTNEEMRRAEQASKEAEAKRWTFDRLWAEYKRQKPGLKGIGPDENRYKNYLKAPFGAKEPKELIPLDTDRLRLRMLKTKSPQTVKLTLALLRRIANFGVQKRLSKPLDYEIEIPTVHNEKTEDLTPTQLSKLLEAIEKDDHPQAGNLMKIALFTGMRRGEMFKLKWKDIDFDRGFISIRDPKGGPDQAIPLNDAARKLLKRHPRTGSPYVFPGRGGKQRTDIHHQVNRIRDNAGLPKTFRALHGLRHVYASMLASSGKVDLYTLQKLLTHKSPVMTQRYAHLRDQALKDAAQVAGDIVNEAMRGKRGLKKIANLEALRK